MNEVTRILVVENCPTLRFGLKQLLEFVPEFLVVGEAGSGDQALSQIQILRPHLVILECDLPDREGTQVVKAVLAMGWETRFVAFASYSSERCVLEMLNAGVWGYILKDDPLERVVEAVHAVADGRVWVSAPVGTHHAIPSSGAQGESLSFTQRELQVLRRIVLGKTNSQIASELSITRRTVLFHLSNLYAKLGVQSRTEAAVWAVRNHIE